MEWPNLRSIPTGKQRRQTSGFHFAPRLRSKEPREGKRLDELVCAFESAASEQVLVLNGWSTVQQMASKWKF